MRKTEGSVRFAQDLDAIIAAAKFDGGSKAVFVQTWPGMYSATGFTPRGKTPAHVYPSYPGAKTLLLSIRLFVWRNRIICQDRLGTNVVRKTEARVLSVSRFRLHRLRADAADERGVA